MGRPIRPRGMIESLMAARQTAPNSGLSPIEQENASKFFAAAVRLYGSQVALAKATGIDQSTISGAIGLRYGIGHKVLAAAARATGIPIESITSGAGTIELEARANPLFDAEGERNKLRATRALCELFDLSPDDVASVFDELGTPLASGTPATVWFDVARAALERRRAGLPLLRRVE